MIVISAAVLGGCLRPYRQRETISRAILCCSGATVSIFLVTFGLIGHLTAGFPSRQANAAAKATALELNYGLGKPCDGDLAVLSQCRTSNSPEILVWGDSFAAHLVDGIIASNPDVALIQMTKGECGPFLDIAPVTVKFPQRWANGCLSFNRHVKEWLRNQNTIKFAVLASLFSQYLEHESAVLYEGKLIRTPPLTFVMKQFEDTLSWLKDQEITPVVFAPPPIHDKDVGDCLLRSNWLGLDDHTCDLDVSAYYANQRVVIQFLEEIQRNHRVVWISKEICGAVSCATRVGNIFLYLDKGHLSHEGSRLIGQKMGFYDIIKSASNPVIRPATASHPDR